MIFKNNTAKNRIWFNDMGFLESSALDPAPGSVFDGLLDPYSNNGSVPYPSS